MCRVGVGEGVSDSQAVQEANLQLVLTEKEEYSFLVVLVLTLPLRHVVRAMTSINCSATRARKGLQGALCLLIFPNPVAAGASTIFSNRGFAGAGLASGYFPHSACRTCWG